MDSLVNNREDFEKWYSLKYVTKVKRERVVDGYFTYSADRSYEAWQEATARAQKIIDELNRKLAIKNDMITALNLTIDTLKALNPDVPCPVCGGSGYDKNEDFKDALGKCGYCTNGTVPLTKAQEYRIKELEAEIERLKEFLQLHRENG